MTKRKSKQNLYTQQTCTFSTFHSLIKNRKQEIPVEAWELLKTTVFWPMIRPFYEEKIEYKCVQKSELDIALLLQHYDVSKQAFVFGKTERSITDEDVLNIFGLPITGDSISFDDNTAPRADHPLIRDHFQVKDPKKRAVVDALDVELLREEKNPHHVACLVIFLLCTSLLFADISNKIRFDILNVVVDLEHTNRIAWGKMVLQFLLHALRDKKPAKLVNYKLGGCLLLIHYWFLENTQVRSYEVGLEQEEPNFIRWSLSPILKQDEVAKIEDMLHTGKRRKTDSTEEVTEKEEKQTQSGCAKCVSLQLEIDGLEEQINWLKSMQVAKSPCQKCLSVEPESNILRERIAFLETKMMEGEELRKHLHKEILDLKGNIRVFCRVRPLLGENATDDSVIFYPTSTETRGRGIDVVKAGIKHQFVFDKVFDHKATQRDVYVEVSQLVQSVLDGYKVCIFAYGQTGSGKTYTMMGKQEPPEHKGLVLRSLDQIFEALETHGRKSRMKVSVLEIYKEAIHDLLSSGSSKEYTIKHDRVGNPYVAGLTMRDVSSKEDIPALLKLAEKNRSVAETYMNKHSSRSHLILTVHVCENAKEQVLGVLNLVDLAGSEKLSDSKELQEETLAINKSLSAIGDVIASLSKKDSHVPFRNSTLTHLLQPSLQKGGKTLMILNISQDKELVNDTHNALRFAQTVNACQIEPQRRMFSPERSALARVPKYPTTSAQKLGSKTAK